MPNKQRCKCKMYELQPWVGLYATPGEDHTRYVCVITDHRLRLRCHPWIPMEEQQHRAEKAMRALRLKEARNG